VCACVCVCDLVRVIIPEFDPRRLP
jgi:hypothetical protein